jgi:serine beta-lactamase-like protein LACTB, mitochondrial
MNRDTHCDSSGLRHQRLQQIATNGALLFAYLLAAGSTSAQTGKPSAEKQAKIETAISKFMAASKVPGISAAVVENGEFVWSAGFGMADLENFVPATSETLYRLGSISKPITSTAAMQLWERGKLDLDSPVQRYCPPFPQKQWPITTRELLGHLGGIRHYNSESQTDLEIGNTRHFENGIEAGLRFFANDPLVAQPGSHFHYSTQGYTLVGCAIEGASGEKYADYVRESILAPAGMLQTRADDRLAIIPFRTRFYSKDKSGAVVNAEFLDSSYKVPGGGWLSSAQDMAKFEVAILTNRLIKSVTRDVMWTPQRPSDGSKDGYGLGWGTGTIEGVADVGHGGGQQGTSTFIMMAPERQAGVVVLINADDADASGLATQLFKIVLGLPVNEHKEITVDPKLFDGYIGTYQLTLDFFMNITREDDHLFVQATGQQKNQIFPESIRDYFLKVVDAQITFVTDSNGRATQLILHQGGMDQTAKRIE